MKKWSLLLLGPLLLAALTACGDKSGGPHVPDQPPEPDGPHIVRSVEVTEAYSEEGEAKTADGYPYNYSFHVPQIEDDTDDAEAINEEIVATFGEMAKENLASIKKKEEPYCGSVGYESYSSGDILSLILKCEYYIDGSEEYAVYNYDTERGARLTNEDLLETLGVTEEDYLLAARRAAAQYYDDAFFSAFGYDGAGIDGTSYAYQERRKWTISEQNINLDLPLYLDDEGAVHAVTPIGSHAGPDFLYQDLVLDLEERAGRSQKVQLGDYLTATLRGNTVTLRLQQTAQLEDILGSAADEIDPALYGQDIPVNGLYGSYTKIFCAGMGMVGAPYVFLLTQEGRVDFINVLECLTNGYFCGCGPILSVEDVADFELAEDGLDLSLVNAVTRSGERIDLQDLASFQGYTIPQSLCGCTWSGSRDRGRVSYTLTLSDGNGDNFFLTTHLSDTGETFEFYGILCYLGMTEQGAVYSYRSWSNLYEYDEFVQKGAVVFSEPEPYGDLSVIELGGMPFVGEDTGDVTHFTRSYN